jgi:hypothetical protein
MKRWIEQALLRVLNSRVINNTPCKYGFVGNIDAFSYEHLASEERSRPGITVKTILEEADRFKSCAASKDGVTVIEPDGTTHEATVWDMHELRLAFAPKEVDKNDGANQ